MSWIKQTFSGLGGQPSFNRQSAFLCMVVAAVFYWKGMNDAGNGFLMCGAAFVTNATAPKVLGKQQNEKK